MGLYDVSSQTKDDLAKFSKVSSSSRDALRAKIYIIDKQTQEICADDPSEVYSSLEDLSDDLPESSPRYVLLHYPLMLADGRRPLSYTLLYWLPENCNPNQRMAYAGAVEKLRSVSGATRVVQVENDEDVIGIEARLKSFY